MQAPADTLLADKVAYLRRPESYPDAPETIEAIETHFAWVFLSRTFVYKLKKPVRFPHLDLSSLQTRRANCELEIALNRRLAADTYLGVVALGRHDGALRLEYSEDVVDWLVKMRRLPREHTLERLFSSIAQHDPRLTALIDRLAEFYHRTARAPWTAEAYIGELQQHSLLSAERLKLPQLRSEQSRIRSIAGAQRSFVSHNTSLLSRRIAEGRVCDAHGDLRPEHIFLLDEPQIIDCLEFSAELRQLDTAEEISFLSLECERRGRADIAEELLRLYCGACDDRVPRNLFDYYRSRRAFVRAFLSAWHLEECADEKTLSHWLEQTRWYISAAGSSIEAALRGADEDAR